MSNPPAIAADSSRLALVAQLREEWDALAQLGGTLTDSEWMAATACPGWSVGAQFAHIIGTESILLGRPRPEATEQGEPPAHVRNEIGAVNEAWVDHLASLPRQEVLGQLVEATAARSAALAGMTDDDFAAPSWTPVGQADYRRFMQIRVFDCWVHEQDVRDAVDRPGHAAGPVAEQSLDELVRAAGFVVGKKAGVPSGSAVRFDLTGPVTRRVDVDVTDRARVVEALSQPPTVVLELSALAFSRLCCGRVEPGAVLDGAWGGVRLTGDTALGRHVVENLAFTI